MRRYAARFPHDSPCMHILAPLAPSRPDHHHHRSISLAPSPSHPVLRLYYRGCFLAPTCTSPSPPHSPVGFFFLDSLNPNRTEPKIMYLFNRLLYFLRPRYSILSLAYPSYRRSICLAPPSSTFSSLRLHHHPSSIQLPVHSPPLLAALRCHAFISLSSSYSPARNLRLPLAPSPLPARFLSRIITYDALLPSLKRAAACRWGARRADSRIRISRRQKKEKTSPLRRPKAGCCINLVWLLYIQLYCSARACVRVTYLAYILACCTAARRRVLVVDALNFLK